MGLKKVKIKCPTCLVNITWLYEVDDEFTEDELSQGWAMDTAPCGHCEWKSEKRDR